LAAFAALPATRRRTRAALMTLAPALRYAVVADQSRINRVIATQVYSKKINSCGCPDFRPRKIVEIVFLTSSSISPPSLFACLASAPSAPSSHSISITLSLSSLPLSLALSLSLSRSALDLRPLLGETGLLAADTGVRVCALRYRIGALVMRKMRQPLLHAITRNISRVKHIEFSV
jgi:hypothetical protein